MSTATGVVVDSAPKTSHRSRLRRQNSHSEYPTAAIAVVVGAFAIALGLYTLSVPNALFGVHPPFKGYDDGVYFGVAVRFVHGVLPYRDFLFIQPPGIVLVMSPLALLSRLIGTSDAFAIARLLTVAVSAVNAVLVVVALRPHGRIAMCIGGGALVLFPPAASTIAQNELEPYVVLFCLIGVVLAFASPSPSISRLMLAGVCFGFASTIKLVAALLAVAFVVCVLPGTRRVLTAAGGALAGFFLPVLIFFLPAPLTFIHEVFIDQLGRMDRHTLTFAQRLVVIFGIGAPANILRANIATFLAVIAIVLVALTWVLRLRNISRLDWFALIATVAVLIEYDVSREFFDHYSYLAAPFEALLLGALVGHIGAGLGRLVSTHVRPWLRALQGATAIVALVLIGFGIPHIIGYSFRYVAGSTLPAQGIDALIPPGACVVSNEVTILVVSNRLVPARNACPAVIDNYGTFIAYDHRFPPPGTDIPKSFVLLWKRYFDDSNFLALSSYYGSWTPPNLTSSPAFKANARISDIVIYRNTLKVFNPPGVGGKYNFLSGAIAPKTDGSCSAGFSNYGPNGPTPNDNAGTTYCLPSPVSDNGAVAPQADMKPTGERPVNVDR